MTKAIQASILGKARIVVLIEVVLEAGSKTKMAL